MLYQRSGPRGHHLLRAHDIPPGSYGLAFESLDNLKSLYSLLHAHLRIPSIMTGVCFIGVIGVEAHTAGGMSHTVRGDVGTLCVGPGCA